MTLQVVSEIVEKTPDGESEDGVSVYCPEEESSGEDETIEKLEKLKRCNSGNVSSQKNSSVNDFNGGNVSNPELPGSGKYFRKLICVRRGGTLEHRINELKSRSTARALFDAAMDYPMDLVKTRFASLKLDGRPVEVIPYPRDDSLKVLTDAVLDFDPDFDPNIKSKYQMSKMPLIEEFLASPEYCRLTDYTLQFRLCRKEVCGICVRIGRRI